jgi:hypothetical protein
MRCLEKEPAARYQAMSELVTDLERALEGQRAAPGSRPASFRLRDDDEASGGRVSIPGEQPLRAWWLAAAVALVGAAAYLAYRSGADEPVVPVQPPTSASAPAPPSTVVATTSPTPAAAPASASAAASVAPVASATTSPRLTGAPPTPDRPQGKPPAKRPPASGGEIVDPWSN